MSSPGDVLESGTTAMCDAIGSLRESMSRYAAAFDPAVVSANDAARVVGDAAAVEKMAATVKGLAAARVAGTDLWRGDGDRNPAPHLARKTGTTVGEAVDAINAARRLEQLPDTAAAARRAELSTSQVSAIADAAAADPVAESRLVNQARRSSLQELKDDCARTRPAAAADAEARRKRIHDHRSLRTYTNSEGAWHMHVRNNPEIGAEIMAAIDPRSSCGSTWVPSCGATPSAVNSAIWSATGRWPCRSSAT